VRRQQPSHLIRNQPVTLRFRRCNVNEVDKRGLSPLHVAARFGHSHIIEFEPPSRPTFYPLSSSS
jgi:hypothetical protein